ncbi:hypothetical protein AYI70_g6787 [Smittium culicis]|uniref:Uncharacterized protein n=1 Tax=Smittium culicis TaxID=133412 RepID=A0A1R1XNF3_9FUNG|nr:hypothetical protein AYI70_g6787 [Smittium culicis]
MSLFSSSPSSAFTRPFLLFSASTFPDIVSTISISISSSNDSFIKLGSCFTFDESSFRFLNKFIADTTDMFPFYNYSSSDIYLFRFSSFYLFFT